MNEEELRNLIELAIGKNQNQNEFSAKASISKEYLNRIIRHPEKYKPSVATLKKISEASNGRVSLNRLEKACGYAPSPKPAEDIEAVGEFYEVKELIRDYKHGLQEFSGKATRYNNIYDVLETVEILYGRNGITYKVGQEKSYEGRGRSGAEMTVNITLEVNTDEYKCEFGFVMFFCQTKRGGIIFSDVAFDLPTLNNMNHPVGGKKLLEISTGKDEDRSKYQTVFIVKKFDRS